MDHTGCAVRAARTVCHPCDTENRFSSFGYWTAPLIFFFGLLLAKAFTGHAAVVEEKTVGILMDFLHLTSASIWVGGIAALVLLLSKEWRQPDKRSRGRRSDGSPHGRSLQSASFCFQACSMDFSSFVQWIHCSIQRTDKLF